TISKSLYKKLMTHQKRTIASSLYITQDDKKLFFLLDDLVHFGRAVDHQRRLKREHEQTDHAAKQATDRQAIEDETSQKCDEKRLPWLFTHKFLRLRHHFGKLVLCIAYAAQCNISVFVHNFVSVARA